MADIRLKNARVQAEIRSEIEQKVRFCGLEVVRLDGVDVLWEASEGDHVVNFRGHDVGVLEVVEGCGCPTVLANHAFVLIFADPVFNSLDRHALAWHYLDLEVGALVLELLV